MHNVLYHYNNSPTFLKSPYGNESQLPVKCVCIPGVFVETPFQYFSSLSDKVRATFLGSEDDKLTRFHLSFTPPSVVRFLPPDALRPLVVLWFLPSVLVDLLGSGRSLWISVFALQSQLEFSLTFTVTRSFSLR